MGAWGRWLGMLTYKHGNRLTGPHQSPYPNRRPSATNAAQQFIWTDLIQELDWEDLAIRCRIRRRKAFQALSSPPGEEQVKGNLISKMK